MDLSSPSEVDLTPSDPATPSCLTPGADVGGLLPACAGAGHQGGRAGHGQADAGPSPGVGQVLAAARGRLRYRRAREGTGILALKQLEIMTVLITPSRTRRTAKTRGCVVRASICLMVRDNS